MKAEEVASRCGAGTLVIGADTVVAVDGEVLGKPGTEERAREMIGKLQEGAPGLHRCDAAACGAQGKVHGCTFAERTDVHVHPMEDGEIAAYAACGEPLDKAGAYGYRGALRHIFKR